MLAKYNNNVDVVGEIMDLHYSTQNDSFYDSLNLHLWYQYQYKFYNLGNCLVRFIVSDTGVGFSVKSLSNLGLI
jgi:hypothetical protein